MKGIIFDLDGTLIDSMYVWYDIDCELLVKNGHPPDEEYISKISTVTFEQGVQYIIERYGIRKTKQELLKEVEAMAYLEYSEKIPLKPGAMEILKKLRSTGKKIALVTSCRQSLCKILLENRGIAGYFDSLVFTEDHNMNKNEPHIYLKAMEALGLPPEECVVFEDSPHAARGAKAAGARVIGVYEKYFHDSREIMKETCDEYISSLADFLEKI